MARSKWKDEEKVEFLIRVGRLLEQGYTLSEAIEVFLKYEKEWSNLILYELMSRLRNGAPFHEAITVLELPETITGMIFFSEQYGDLSKGLIEAGAVYKKTILTKKKLQKLLRYPIFLIWLVIVFMFIMFTYLFPQYTILFASLNLELPLLTKLFISLLNYLPSISLIVLAIILTIVLYYVHLFKGKSPNLKAEILVKLPIIQYFYRLMITYTFAQHLSALLRSGMSIFEALTVFKMQTQLKMLQFDAGVLITRLEKGYTLHQVLAVNPIYLSGLAYIVEHGQSNGKLAEELQHYGEWLLHKFEDRIRTIFLIMQPMLFSFVGLLVLLMFASILLPIFSLLTDM